MTKLVPAPHLKTLRAITQPGKTITLDSRIPAHRDHIFHMYGGEGYAKLHMPEQHKVLKQVFNNHALGQGLDYKTLNQINEPTTDFVDLVSVEFVDYNPATKILRVTAVTSLVNPASIDHHLEIFTKAGEAVDGQIATSPNTTHAEISIETDFDPAEFSSPTLEIHYSVNWFDSESGTMKSQIHSADVGEEILSISPVKSITMKAPINRNTPQGSRIIVCYRRTPSRGEIADYVFPEQIVDNKQELYLDFAANVEFDPAMNAVFKTIDVSTFTLRMDCGRGGASYQKNRAIANHFTPEDYGFKFVLDSDWLDSVPTARGTLTDIVNLTFYVEYLLTDGTRDTIQISSYVGNSDSPNLKSIPTLGLLWGCLAKGTLVAMADGSQKAIENIKIGDTVLTDAHGGTSRVTNTWQGAETRIIRITTAAGQLDCSDSHPVRTTVGMTRAHRITTEHSLVGRGGEHLPVLSIETKDGDYAVYNLDLAGNGTFFANGVLVGDNGVQNNLSDEKPEAKSFDLEAKQALYSDYSRFLNGR